ncbi:transcriptional regulator [Candidatus Binatus sp.]|uniref:transcriptional regulator n=1 Tax=Candidatus Binatus sp. TaxID=2811406 RepID=UPI003C6F8C56
MLANPRYVPRHLTARELVIDFLSNRYPREMSVQKIAGVGIALGFSEQSLRMALTRLVEQSVAANTGRGRYRLSPSGEAMRDEVRKWRHLDDLAKPWSGAWIGVFDAAIPRSDRAALRRHERAMRLRGFRELQSGLWLRPANLRDSVAELRDHLRALGLHPAALVVGLNDLDEDARAKATGLWDTAAMLATYRALTDELLASKGKLERLPLDTAAAESMVLGRDVIRHINLDPVLPEELMPNRALTNLIRVMTDYDQNARQIWRRFMRAHAPRE